MDDKVKRIIILSIIGCFLINGVESMHRPHSEKHMGPPPGGMGPHHGVGDKMPHPAGMNGPGPGKGQHHRFGQKFHGNRQNIPHPQNEPGIMPPLGSYYRKIQPTGIKLPPGEQKCHYCEKSDGQPNTTQQCVKREEGLGCFHWADPNGMIKVGQQKPPPGMGQHQVFGQNIPPHQGIGDSAMQILNSYLGNLSGISYQNKGKILDNIKNTSCYWINDPKFQKSPEILIDMMKEKADKHNLAEDLSDYEFVKSRTLNEAEKNYLVCLSAVRNLFDNQGLSIQVAAKNGYDAVKKMLGQLNTERQSDAKIYLNMIKARELCTYEFWK